jgi:TP901 family phage tail tape measure protein
VASAGYGTGGFANVSRELQNVAFQFTSILSLQMQIKASLSAWRDLERELTVAQAAASGTRAEFVQMEAAARNFALATTFSAGQVANAFYSLASAGLNVKQTLQAATGVILLAQATMTDLGEASDLTASTMAQFNLQASESYRVSNLFVAATNTSLATVNKLSFALRQVGPIAAQSNLSLEQTVGILDKLFDAGLRGEQAGTALRNTLARLSNPVGAGSEVLRAYGIKQLDDNGQIKDRIQLLKELAAVKPSQSSLTTIVGIEGAAAMNILLKSLTVSTKDSTTALEQHINKITNTNDAYRQAAMQMNTLDGSMTQMSNNFNELRIIAGQQLTPVMVYLSNTVAGFTDGVRDLNQVEIMAYVQMGLWVVSAIALGKGLSVLGGTLTSVTGGMTKLRDARVDFALLRGAAGATTFAEKMALAGSSLTGFVSGFAALASGVLVIGGMIYAAYQLAEAWDKVAKAKEKAANDMASKNILGSAALSQGMDDKKAAAFSNTEELAGNFAKQFSNLQRTFNVGSDGGGSFQRFRATQELISSTTDQLNLLRDQAKVFSQTYSKNKSSYEKMVSDLDEFMNNNGFMDRVSRAMGGGQADRIGSETGEQFAVRSVKSAGGNPAEIIRTMANSLSAIANAPIGGEYQAAVKAYSANVIGAINKAEGLSVDQRKIAIERVRRFTTNIDSADKTLQGAAKIAAEKSAKGLKDAIESGDNTASAVSATSTTFVDTMRENLILTDEQLAARIALMQSEYNQIKSTLARATADNASLAAPIKQEMLQFILSAGDVNGEETKKVWQFAKTEAGKNALDGAQQAIQNGKSQRDGIKIIIDAMRDAKIFNNAYITQQVEQWQALPLIDERALRKWGVQAKVAELKAMMELVKLGKPMDTRTLAQLAADIRQTEAGANGGEVVDKRADRNHSADKYGTATSSACQDCSRTRPAARCNDRRNSKLLQAERA